MTAQEWAEAAREAEAKTRKATSYAFKAYKVAAKAASDAFDAYEKAIAIETEAAKAYKVAFQALKAEAEAKAEGAG